MPETTGPAYILRRPIDEDRAQWAELWRAYLAFYDTELPEAQYDRQFDRLTGATEPTVQGFVAEADGQLIGLVHYLYHAHGWKEAETCYLQDLYVAPDARGTGLGRALIEAVYAQADTDGISGVYWLTQEFNHTARQLYDRVAHKTPFIVYRRA